MRSICLRWSFSVVLGLMAAPLLAADNRGYQKSNDLLEIHGTKIDPLKKTQVIDNSSNFQLKVEQGFSNLGPLARLLSPALSGASHSDLGGFSLVHADFNYNAVSETTFGGNTHFTEVTFPAVNAASKDAGFLSYVLQADKSQQKKASGKIKSAIGARQKNWLPSNFRFQLGGLDGKTSGTVHKINAIHAVMTPGQPAQFDPVVVTFGLADGDKLQHWFNTHKGKTTTGGLVFLAANLKTSLGQLRFNALVPESMTTNGNLVQVTFSVSKAVFSWSGSGA
jgi:hypothetical protein